MNQLVNVHRRNGTFLMHPSSAFGAHDAWVAHQPGVGISCEADDSSFGELLFLLRRRSQQGLPLQEIPANAQPPFASLAGVKSWDELASDGPLLVSVIFGELVIEVRKADGRGALARIERLELPSEASPAQVAAIVRRMFDDAA